MFTSYLLTVSVCCLVLSKSCTVQYNFRAFPLKTAGCCSHKWHHERMNVRTRQSNNGMWAEQQIWAICLLRFITISNITLSFDSLLFYNIGYSRFKHIKLTHLCKVAHVWNGDLPGWPDTSSLSRLQCRLPATSQKWQASLWEVERITRVRYRVKEREREQVIINKWLTWCLESLCCKELWAACLV